MANRHLARSIVLQSLFEWDFKEGKNADISSIVENNAHEFGPGLPDISFMRSLAESIIEKREKLDTVIESSAPEWPIDRISIVDRNVLRIGLYELLYAGRTEVPAKVAINEAIELAKTFGGENSGRFINGVLGTVYKELGEPGKDERGKRGMEDTSKMPREILGGALVYRNLADGGGVMVALVHDVFGYWTLSKGHIESAEDERMGAAREIREELGVDVTIGEKIGENEYTASDPEKGKLRKHVSYFLAETKDTELTLHSGDGLVEANGVSLDDLSDLKIYHDILPLLTTGVIMLFSHR